MLLCTQNQPRIAHQMEVRALLSGPTSGSVSACGLATSRFMSCTPPCTTSASVSSMVASASSMNRGCSTVSASTTVTYSPLQNVSAWLSCLGLLLLLYLLV